MNRFALVAVVVLSATGFVAFGATNKAPPPKPVVVHEKNWTFNGDVCGTTWTQCKPSVVAAAKAAPGVMQQAFPPPVDVTMPASGGTAPPPAPCPNIGAIQPGDHVDADGTPHFDDPCHANVAPLPASSAGH